MYPARARAESVQRDYNSCHAKSLILGRFQFFLFYFRRIRCLLVPN